MFVDEREKIFVGTQRDGNRNGMMSKRPHPSSVSKKEEWGGGATPLTGTRRRGRWYSQGDSKTGLAPKSRPFVFGRVGGGRSFFGTQNWLSEVQRGRTIFLKKLNDSSTKRRSRTSKTLIKGTLMGS